MQREVINSGFHEMYELSYKKEEARFPMPPHTHNAIEMYLALSDLPSVLLGNNVFQLKKDTLLIIPSYCIHKMVSVENSVYERYVFMINTAWLDNILGVTAYPEYQYLKDSNRPLIIPLDSFERNEIIEKLERLMKCGNKNIFIKMHVFFDVMCWIYQKSGKIDEMVGEQIRKNMSGTARTVSEMMDYINAHLYENITIEKIAERFYLNHDYVSRIFKKHVNTSIKNYIKIQRITKAQQLLLEGNSIVETQIKTGYGSYEHFFRTFKKVTGKTPKEYREQYSCEDKVE